MKHTLNISLATLSLIATLTSYGMQQQSTALNAVTKSPSTVRKDTEIPVLVTEERNRLAKEFEDYSSSGNPEELRRAFFATVSVIAHTALDKRDATIEANAQKIRGLISSHYANQDIRETNFLYGVGQVLNKPAKDDRYPHRELYTPVEQIRDTLKQNTEKQNGLQKTTEELAKEESLLDQQIAELTKKRAEAQKRKASQLKEIVMVVQANNTLAAQSACHQVQLQENRDSLINTIETTITEFVTLKNKLTQANVDHERDNLLQRIQETDAKIIAQLDSLWFCMHYLQRMNSPNGSLGPWDETKWKVGLRDYSTLDINNYQDYLTAKK